MMIKNAVLRKFVKTHIASHFPEFHLYRGVNLVRVYRPLLQGLVFEPAGDDDFYTTCFVQFLTIRQDFMGIGFGERIFRIDRPGQTYRIEPAGEEASKLIKTIRQSVFSPFKLKPNCGNVLKLREEEECGAHTFFGLATCAIFENDPGLARHYLNLSRERTGPPIYDWRKKLLAEIEEIEDGLDDLAATQMKLRQWVEETIRLLGMQKFG